MLLPQSAEPRYVLVHTSPMTKTHRPSSSNSWFTAPKRRVATRDPEPCTPDVKEKKTMPEQCRCSTRQPENSQGARFDTALVSFTPGNVEGSKHRSHVPAYPYKTPTDVKETMMTSSHSPNTKGDRSLVQTCGGNEERDVELPTASVSSGSWRKEANKVVTLAWCCFQSSQTFRVIIFIHYTVRTAVYYSSVCT